MLNRQIRWPAKISLCSIIAFSMSRENNYLTPFTLPRPGCSAQVDPCSSLPQLQSTSPVPSILILSMPPLRADGEHRRASAFTFDVASRCCLSQICRLRLSVFNERQTVRMNQQRSKVGTTGPADVEQPRFTAAGARRGVEEPVPAQLRTAVSFPRAFPLLMAASTAVALNDCTAQAANRPQFLSVLECDLILMIRMR